MAYRMFIFGESLEEAIEAIPEEYQLRFYRMIKDYGLHGIEPTLTGFEQATWVQMKSMIDRTIPRRNNASPVGKVGAPFGNKNAQKTKNNQNNSNNYAELFSDEGSENNSETTDSIQNNQNNSAEMLNVNDNVNDNVNGDDLSGSKEPPKKKRSPKQKKEKTVKAPIREREPDNDMERVEKVYLQNWDSLYSQGRVKKPEPLVNWKQTRSLLKNLFVGLNAEEIIQAIDNGLKDDWIVNSGYSLGLMLSANVLNRLINAPTGQASHRIVSDNISSEELGDYFKEARI